MASSAPDVSVVVIVYNDVARLPRAVASVLAQTLPSVEVLIVDDASTDGSGEAADALAAAQPDRVRVIHLASNSGGCSRPRNAGLEQARGDYVMFLDSDDELAPDACRVLWTAAVAEQADFSTGLTMRVLLAERGRRKPWKPKVYEQRVVAHGIAAFPALINDSTSTNKCWRRDFLNAQGLRFPEGIHYEDIVFTAEAYLAASTFVVVPELVYIWYVDDRTGQLSITSRKSDLANLGDRLEANRRIDARIVGSGLNELKIAKDVKFIRHDLRLYVSELLVQDQGWRDDVFDLLIPYLHTLEPESAAAAGKMHEIEVFYVHRRDLAGLRTTARYIRQRGKVAQSLVRRDGRVYWGDRYLDAADARAALDVTDLGLDQLGPADFPFFHLVTELRREDGRLRLAGTSLNQFGWLDDAALSLRISPRGRGQRARWAPLTRGVGEGDLLTWSASLDATTLLGRWRPAHERYDVRLQAQVGNAVNLSTVTLDAAPGKTADVPLRAGVPRLTATHVRPYVTKRGNLALRAMALSPATRRARSWLARLGGRSATPR